MSFIIECFEPLKQRWEKINDKKYNSLKDAFKCSQKIRDDLKRYNKERERDLRPNSYGTVQILNLRIRDLKTNKIYPSTDHDKKQFKKYKEYYMMC